MWRVFRLGQLVTSNIEEKINSSYLVFQTTEGSSTKLIRTLVRSSNYFLGSIAGMSIVDHDDVEVGVGDLEYGIQHCWRHGGI